MAITDEDRLMAEARMRAVLAGQSRARSVRFDAMQRTIIVELIGGGEVALAVDDLPGLAGARSAALARIELTPLGDGLHWPALDADLYLPPLLEGAVGATCESAARTG